jgi:hypothetical protein
MKNFALRLLGGLAALIFVIIIGFWLLAVYTQYEPAASIYIPWSILCTIAGVSFTSGFLGAKHIIPWAFKKGNKK